MSQTDSRHDAHIDGLSRRDFLVAATGTAVALSAWGLPALAQPVSGQVPGPHRLMALPWDDQALAPVISAQTLLFHHGRHHRGYVDNLNRLVVDTPLADASLEAVVKASAGRADRVSLFNNAAQVWNHDFYWRSLRPDGGGQPPQRLREMMQESFGSVAACRQALRQSALRQFGSGWAWLVQDGDRLRVVSTGDAELPLTERLQPLLTLDVWEHAYYLDHQNRRGAYIDALIDRHVDWGFAEDNLRA